MTPAQHAALAAIQRATEALTKAAEALQAIDAPQASDRLLSAKEASRRTGMSTRWLYLQVDKQQLGVRVGLRAVRFSERAIDKWIAQRQRAKIS